MAGEIVDFSTICLNLGRNDDILSQKGRGCG